MDALPPAAASVVLTPPPRRWAVVLAGGDGVRLRPYVARRFGDERPKQYCAFSGTRSMLQHTLDRAARLAAAERTVTVVAAAHERWSRPQLTGHPGRVVTQPINRETGPGLYLPLAYVRAAAPDAVVYVLPSDHYVSPDDRFVASVRAAGDVAEAHPDRIVLTGVVPDGPEIEYGYIEPGPALGIDRNGALRGVARFIEKPGLPAAAEAIVRGAVWNTMVMAARVDALWEAGRACIPEVMRRFDALVDAIGTPFEAAILHEIYLTMPTASFSRDVLERVTDRCLTTRLEGVEWSDWGQAERIEATIARLARRRAPATGQLAARP